MNDRHFYRAGWLTLYRPERQTYVLLHRCGLYTEVDADMPPELFGAGAWEALEQAAAEGASGRHDLEVTQHGAGMFVGSDLIDDEEQEAATVWRVR